MPDLFAFEPDDFESVIYSDVSFPSDDVESQLKDMDEDTVDLDYDFEEAIYLEAIAIDPTNC
jgi:hypothetical protein